MFNFNELRGIHLEITSRCQAACPMCARNYHGGLPNPNLVEGDWTLEDFKKIISKEVLEQIQYFYFCGNYGDPMVNNDLIEMCRYSKNIAPHVSIKIHTNGGARKPEWWSELGTILDSNDHVIFAIDGLEDTHHLYRVNTTYERVIENSKAFIDAGGQAEWSMLVFKHNEHQVDEARQRAKQLGFINFNMKASTRFIASDKYEVYDKERNITHYLEPASTTNLNFITQEQVDGFQTWVDSTEISCVVKYGKEIYIDAQKILSPCCFIAPAPYIFNDGILAKPQEKIKQQYYSLVESLGGFEKLNTINNSLKEIINSNAYQTVWDYYWNENKLIMCAKTCGKATSFSQPRDQFIEAIEL